MAQVKLSDVSHAEPLWNLVQAMEHKVRAQYGQSASCRVVVERPEPCGLWGAVSARVELVTPRGRASAQAGHAHEVRAVRAAFTQACLELVAGGSRPAVEVAAPQALRSRGHARGTAQRAGQALLLFRRVGAR